VEPYEEFSPKGEIQETPGNKLARAHPQVKKTSAKGLRRCKLRFSVIKTSVSILDDESPEQSLWKDSKRGRGPWKGHTKSNQVSTSHFATTHLGPHQD